MTLNKRFKFADPVDEAHWIFRSLFFGLAKQVRYRKGITPLAEDAVATT